MSVMHCRDGLQIKLKKIVIYLQVRKKKSSDFVEGLCMLLCGVTANLSSSIFSAPLAHVLIVDDSRFKFSHKNSPLLLTQTKHVLEGNKQVSYYLRSGYDENGGKVNWPEMFASNYIERPEKMGDVYLYEFVQKYKVEYLGGKKV